MGPTTSTFNLEKYKAGISNLEKRHSCPMGYDPITPLGLGVRRASTARSKT